MLSVAIKKKSFWTHFLHCPLEFSFVGSSGISFLFCFFFLCTLKMVRDIHCFSHLGGLCKHWVPFAINNLHFFLQCLDICSLNIQRNIPSLKNHVSVFQCPAKSLPTQLVGQWRQRFWNSRSNHLHQTWLHLLDYSQLRCYPVTQWWRAGELPQLEQLKYIHFIERQRDEGSILFFLLKLSITMENTEEIIKIVCRSKKCYNLCTWLSSMGTN